MYLLSRSKMTLLVSTTAADYFPFFPKTSRLLLSNQVTNYNICLLSPLF